MAKKHYQFHYAEMDKGNLVNLGVLHFQSNNSANREQLISIAQGHLKKPTASIIISHVTKLSKEEFELETGRARIM